MIVVLKTSEIIYEIIMLTKSPIEKGQSLSFCKNIPPQLPPTKKKNRIWRFIYDNLHEMPSTDSWEKLEIKYITSLPSAELAKSVVKVKTICQTGGSLDDNIIAYLISATGRDI